MILGGLVMSFTYFAVNVFVKGLGPALASLTHSTAALKTLAANQSSSLFQ
jgi:hypothetical protein